MTRMTKNVFLIGMILFPSMAIGGFNDSGMLQGYNQGPVLIGHVDEIPFEFVALYRHLGVIDDIPPSVEYYIYGVEVMGAAMLTKLIELYVNRITGNSGRSLIPADAVYERFSKGIALFAASQLMLLKVEDLVDLKKEGTVWKFALFRLFQLTSSLLSTCNVCHLIKELFCHRQFYHDPLPLQRSSMLEECPICWIEKRIKVVPCGDSRHKICVACYRRLVRDTRQYQCPFCAQVVPQQKITVRKVRKPSVCDKINRLTLPEKFSICMLLLSECIILYSIFLSVNEDFCDPYISW